MARTDLSAALAAERTKRSITQIEAAALFGISDATFNRWEKGQVKPNLTAQLLDALGDFLGISQEALEHLLVVSEIQMNEQRAET